MKKLIGNEAECSANSSKIADNKVTIFFLCYFSYCGIHILRISWSMIKASLSNQIGFTPSILGVLDFLFLTVYAIGNVLGGKMGETINKKKFLIVINVTSGISLILVSFVDFLSSYQFTYLAFVLMLNGAFQAAGFPTNVSIISMTFHSANRGFVLGLWFSCQAFGNIIGQQLSSLLIDGFQLHWTYVCYIGGSISILNGLLVLIFMPHLEEMKEYYYAALDQENHLKEHNLCQYCYNSDVGTELEQYNKNQHPEKIQMTSSKKRRNSEEFKFDMKNDDIMFIQKRKKKYKSLFGNLKEAGQSKFSISRWCLVLLQTFKIKHLLQYASNFFFNKLIIYSLAFWLPFVLKNVQHFSLYQAAIIASLFETGGIVGFFCQGYVADKYFSKQRCIVVFSCQFIGTFVIGLLFFAYSYLWHFLMFFVGFFITGSSSLVAGTIPSELQQEKDAQNDEHKQLKDWNSLTNAQEAKKENNAISTATGIIDGFGSLGSAIGNLSIGQIQSFFGWTYTLIFLLSSSTASFCVIMNIFIKDVKSYKQK